jgi:hypothetical protein
MEVVWCGKDNFTREGFITLQDSSMSLRITSMSVISADGVKATTMDTGCKYKRMDR